MVRATVRERDNASNSAVEGAATEIRAGAEDEVAEKIGQKLRQGLGLSLRSGKSQRVQGRIQEPRRRLRLIQQRGQVCGPRRKRRQRSLGSLLRLGIRLSLRP